MAKDAKGHGSESRRDAVAAGRALASHQLKIQHLDTSLLGNPWRTVGAKTNRATAERIAQHMRTDNADTLVRVR